MSFTNWLAQADGKHMNLDGVYGTQCVDVFLDYASYLYGGIWRSTTGWGNAKDLYANSNPQYWQKIANSPDPNHIPKAGDVVVWGAKTGNPYGHIAVCIVASSANITVLQQDGFIDYNKDGNADGVGHRKVQTWSGVIGWLRPISQTKPAPVPSGEEMISTRDQAIKIYKLLRPNGNPSEAEITGTVGRRTFAAFLNDAQAEVRIRDTNIAAQAKALAEAQAAINSLNDRPTRTDYAKVQAIVTEKNAEVERLQRALEVEIKNIKTVAVMDPQVTADLTWIKSKLLTLQGMIANLFKMFRR